MALPNTSPPEYCLAEVGRKWGCENSICNLTLGQKYCSGDWMEVGEKEKYFAWSSRCPAKKHVGCYYQPVSHCHSCGRGKGTQGEAVNVELRRHLKKGHSYFPEGP